MTGDEVGTDIPGPRSRAHWVREQALLGPGLQAVVQWARLTVARAEGARIFDVDGNVFVDFMGGAGVNSIGHSHPTLVEALKEQLDEWTIGSFASAARLEMLERLAPLLPAGLDRIQLYSGGAEAVEAALRLAKSATGKYEFLSFWNGFHGKTLGALALTSGARQGLGPTPPGFFSAPFGNCYHCPLKLRPDTCGLACVELARDVVRRESTGALAAIVVEPVQGRAGNVPAPPGYLAALKDLAREFDALLIADETLTGFGRSGEFLACDHEAVLPDVVIVGKGMGGGFPVSGVVAGAELMSASPFSDPSASSSSYGGFPLACAAVAATLRVIVEEDLIPNVRAVGARLLARLKDLEHLRLVGEVRGRGLMLGIELVADPAARTPVPRETVRDVFLALLEQGLIVMVGGNSLRLYPPLSLDDATADDAAGILERVLETRSSG